MALEFEEVASLNQASILLADSGGVDFVHELISGSNFKHHVDGSVGNVGDQGLGSDNSVSGGSRISSVDEPREPSEAAVFLKLFNVLAVEVKVGGLLGAFDLLLSLPG